MAENEKNVDQTKVNNRKRIDNLKSKIASMLTIANSEITTASKGKVNSCTFTTESLSDSNKFAMVNMDSKTERGSSESFTFAFNVNKLSTISSTQFVSEVLKLTGKDGQSKATVQQVSNDIDAKIRDAEPTVLIKICEFLAQPNIEDILKYVPGATADNIDKLDPNELSKDLLFMLSEEKVDAILVREMGDKELEDLIKGVVSDGLSEMHSDAKDKRLSDRKKAHEEENSKDGSGKDQDAREEEFRREIEKGDLNKAETLLNTNAHDKGEAIGSELAGNATLKASFEELENNINTETLRKFGNEFSKAFMQEHGLPANLVPIVVKGKCPDGSNTLGEFADYGDSFEIEIYRDNIHDLAEFTATLAHELTHAVDAAVHKGIQNNMSTDISGNGLSARGEKLLKHLNWTCYQTNVAEQTARNGEQIGLSFLSKVGGPKYDAQIAKYNKEDAEIQAKVDHARANLEKTIYDAEQTCKELPASDRSKPGWAMIQERIGYLKARQNERDRGGAVNAQYKENREKHTTQNTSESTLSPEEIERLRQQNEIGLGMG